MGQGVRFVHEVLSSGQHAITSPDVRGFCVVGGRGDPRAEVERQAAECLALLQGLDASVPRGPGYFKDGAIAPGGDRPRESRVASLLEAVAALPDYAAGMGLPSPSPAGIALARDFVAALPDDRMLPRVAVDCDGDVLMAWGERGHLCAMTFEGITIHAVVMPGACSTHLDPVACRGGEIPAAVLDAVPRE